VLRRAETARTREHIEAPAVNVDAYVHENRLSPLHGKAAVLQASASPAQTSTLNQSWFEDWDLHEDSPFVQNKSCVSTYE
jgi:hypothetical protein